MITALWQAASGTSGLAPCNVGIQKRGRDDKNPLDVERAKRGLGSSPQAESAPTRCGWVVGISCSATRLLFKPNVEINWKTAELEANVKV